MLFSLIDSLCSLWTILSHFPGGLILKELHEFSSFWKQLNNNDLDKSNSSISPSHPKSYVTLSQPTSYTESFQSTPPSPTLGVLRPVRPGLWSRLTFFPDCSYIIGPPGGQLNNNLGLEYFKKIKRAWIYSRFSRQNDLYAILEPRRPGSAYGAQAAL